MVKLISIYLGNTSFAIRGGNGEISLPSRISQKTTDFISSCWGQKRKKEKKRKIEEWGGDGVGREEGGERNTLLEKIFITLTRQYI